MNKTEELKQKLKEYPDHELIFVYPGEGSEYDNAIGYPSYILVDEYWIDDERLYLRYEDEDELREEICERIFDQRYEDRQPGFSLNDKGEKELEKEAKEWINNRNWKKCISVQIQP